VNLVEKKSPSANRNDLVQKKGPTPGPRRRGISATRDWVLTQDRAWAGEREARAAAAAAEARRFPAYAAADPEVVVGALRELRETRWTDPRTLRHGASGGRDFEDGASRR
jgi:hypothetical protein